jgi:hypothetical protein
MNDSFRCVFSNILGTKAEGNAGAQNEKGSELKNFLHECQDHEAKAENDEEHREEKVLAFDLRAAELLLALKLDPLPANLTLVRPASFMPFVRLCFPMGHFTLHELLKTEVMKP